MVVGGTSFRNFRIGKNPNSFIILEVYIGVGVEKLFSLDNALLRILAYIFRCWSCTHHVNVSFLPSSFWSLVVHSCVLDTLLHTLGRCGLVCWTPDVIWLDANFLNSNYFWRTFMNKYSEPVHDLIFLESNCMVFLDYTIYPRSWYNKWMKMMMSLKCHTTNVNSFWETS